MTNETIIKSTLKYLVKRQIEEGSVGFAVDNDHDHDCCWDDVLAWLEAQPSEDCISRQKVFDVINFEDEWLFDAKSYNADTKIAFSAIKSKISELPSVTPQTVTEFADKCKECGKIQNEFFNFDAPMVKKSDAVSREAVIKNIKGWFDKIELNPDILIDSIITLPSVIPQRKRGQWIFKAFDEETGISDSYWCSECNRPLASAYNDYCSNCGSYNAEIKESADD